MRAWTIPKTAFLIPLVVITGCQSPISNPNTSQAQLDAVYSMMSPHQFPHNWLIEKVEIEAEEARNISPISGYGSEKKVFGSKNTAWNSFKSQLVTGDECWSWSTNFISGLNTEFHGYCLIRNGRIVAVVHTGMITSI